MDKQQLIKAIMELPRYTDYGDEYEGEVMEPNGVYIKVDELIELLRKMGIKGRFTINI